MTPRNNIEWVHSETILEDFLSQYKEHPHSRFPVYEDEYDDVVGILSTKDVVTSIAQGNLKSKDPIIRIMRAALFVPEAKRLDELFTSMRQSGHKIALVVDEFGGVSGLMTLSKVIEQIVGTTGEEGLSPKERFITIDTDTYEIEASMSVDEANNLLELNIPEGDYETIAGFILETAQSIPSIGKRLRYGDLRMTVTSMEGNKLEKVRIRKRPNLYE
jgi:putative hemolysin